MLRKGQSLINRAKGFVAAVMWTRDVKQWRLDQVAGLLLDPQNRSRWRHDRRGPQSRWEDVFVHFAGEDWKIRAMGEGWQPRMEEFVVKGHSWANTDHTELKFHGERQSDPLEPVLKKPRQIGIESAPWRCVQGVTSVELRSDNELAIQWVTGEAAVKNRRYKPGVEAVLGWAETIMAMKGVGCRQAGGELFRHIYREHNTEADLLAGSHEDTVWLRAGPWPRLLRGSSDGSKRGERVGCGWIIEGSWNYTEHPNAWEVLAKASWMLPGELNALEAEMLGLQSLVRGIVICLQLGEGRGEREVGSRCRPQMWQRGARHSDTGVLADT